MKRCRDCGETKEQESFNKDKSTKDGFRNQCRECQSLYYKGYHSRTSEVRAEKRKTYYEENKDIERARNKDYYDENQEVLRGNRRQKYSENGESWRKKYLSSTYQLTLKSYDEMVAAQKGACAICGKMNPNGYNLFVDHDHSCCNSSKSCGECIRGLLCRRCNLGIGNFLDDVLLLKKAIEYLNDYNSN